MLFIDSITPEHLLLLENPDITDNLDLYFQYCESESLSFEIEKDYSPVMRSEDSFIAKIEHEGRKIILNGFAVDRTDNPNETAEYLKYHELFHFVHRTNSDIVFKRNALGLNEEQLADLFAYYVVRIRK